MRVSCIVALLLLAAGCSQQEAEQKEATNELVTNVVEAARPEVPALNGSWKLTKLDGRPLGAMALTFAAGRASVAAGCNRRAWAFTQERNIVAFTADPGGSINCGSSPSVDEEAAFHALDRATIAIFDKDGSEASLSGTGGNITLVRR